MKKPGFGRYLTAPGDVDQDGIPDLFTGTAGTSTGSNSHKGHGFVLLLKSDGSVKDYLVVDATALGISRHLAYLGNGVATLRQAGQPSRRLQLADTDTGQGTTAGSSGTDIGAQ